MGQRSEKEDLLYKKLTVQQLTLEEMLLDVLIKKEQISKGTVQ